MTLAELLEPRGVEAQLYPLLPNIGMSPGDYSKRRQEATEKLLSAGYLVMPTERVHYRDAMIEIAKLLELMGPTHHLIIPDDNPVLFRGENRISKLPTHKVRRYEDLPQAEKKKTLLMATENMLRSANLGWRVIGYDFMNKKGERNTVQLIDIIRAYEMMEDSYDPSNVLDKSINKTPGKRYSAGMNAEVINVPSADSDRAGEKYDISLRHIVMVDRFNAEQYGLDKADAALTFNLQAKDPCPKDTKLMLGYGRKTKTTENLLISDENLLDHHIIFAYLAYQRFISETKPDKLVPDLFPKSKESFRDAYFWPLYSRALKERPDPETGNITRVPLAMGEIESILWGVIGYKNEIKSGKLK